MGTSCCKNLTGTISASTSNKDLKKCSRSARFSSTKGGGSICKKCTETMSHWPPTGSTGAIVLWCLVVVVLVVMVLVVVVANTSS